MLMYLMPIESVRSFLPVARRLGCAVIICLPGLFIFAVGADETDAKPYARISEEAYKARLPFFDIDPGIPLEARVVREWQEDDSVRQKIVFRGAQGFLVPAYLEIPKAVDQPPPLVLLLHGWSGSKEDWYEDENFINGGLVRKGLLEEGCAVLALDASTHGERSNEIDYQHVNAFDDPTAPARRNYLTFAEISVQTVKDYRRALDYLTERGGLDLSRIGIVGYSMGGMDALFLLAAEPRITMAVACVPPLTNTSYDPASPVDYTWGIDDRPLLLLMGSEDEMYEKAQMDATYREYIEGPHTQLKWYDQGHKLTEIYVPDALAWVKEHL